MRNKAYCPTHHRLIHPLYFRANGRTMERLLIKYVCGPNTPNAHVLDEKDLPTIHADFDTLQKAKALGLFGG